MATHALRVLITANQQGLDRALNRAGGGLKKFGMAAGAAGAAVGAGLVVQLKASVDAAVEAQKAQARFESQMKASGKSLRAHGGEIERTIQAHSRLAGIDDEDLSDAFTNILRSTGSVNKSMKLLNVTTDLARAKNMDVAKAGQLVGKVATGNVTALSRYGIQIDENATSTEALAVLQQKFAGQAKAYGETAAGAQERFGVAVENLQEKIGARLLPVITSVTNHVATFVGQMESGSGAGGRFADRVSEGFRRLQAVAAVVFPVLQAGAGVALDAVRVAFDRVGAAIRAVMPALQSVAATISAHRPQLEAFAATVGGALATAFNAARVAVTVAFNAIRGVVAGAIGFMGGWINKHRDDIGAFGNAWKNIGKAVLVAVGALATGLKFYFENVIVPAMRVVLSVVKAVWPSIQRIIDAALRAIGGLVNVFAGVFTGDWRRVWNGVKQIFSGAKDALLGIVGGLLKGIVALVSGVGRELFNAATRLGDFLKNGIKDGLKGLGNLIKDAIVEGVTWAARNVPRLIGSALKGLGSAITNAIKSGFSKLNPFDGMGDAMGTPSFPGTPGGAAPLGGLPTSGLAAVASRGLSFINSRFGAVRLTSGRRSPEENRRVGGAPNSDHLTGLGTDLVPAAGWTPAGVALLDRVANWAKSSPLIRWIGWRGVPGHGPGDHLHLSWVGGAGDVAMSGGRLKAYGGRVRGVGDVSGRGHVQLIRDAASKAGIDPAILYGVWGAESRFSRGPGPTSPAGAQGPFQFMPATARSMGVNSGDLTSSAYGAARYLAQYKSRGVSGMLAAYNAGPYGNPNNAETRAYIPRVQGFARQWAALAGSTRSGGGGSGTTSVGGTGGTTTAGGAGGGGSAPKAAPEPTYGPRAASGQYAAAVESVTSARTKLAAKRTGPRKGTQGGSHEDQQMAKLIYAEMVLKSRRLGKVRKALKRRLTKGTRSRLVQEEGQLVADLAELSDLMYDLTGGKSGQPSAERVEAEAQAGREAASAAADAEKARVAALPTESDYLDASMAEAERTGTKSDDAVALRNRADYQFREYQAAVASGDPRRIAETRRALTVAEDAMQALADAVENEVHESGIARAKLTESLDDDVAAATSFRDYLKGKMDAALADDNLGNDASAINAYIAAKDAVEELTKTMNTANEIQQRRDDLNRQIADNQLKILALANQGPQIVAAVIAAVNGGIGGNVGLGFQTPGYAGQSARY